MTKEDPSDSSNSGKFPFLEFSQLSLGVPNDVLTSVCASLSSAKAIEQTLNAIKKGLSVEDFVTLLFEKAPADFIESSTLTELHDIAQQCISVCGDFISKSNPLSMQIGNRNGTCYVIIAMGDRPFTINTVVGVIREFGSDVKVLLHPLISLMTGQRLSLLYFEFDKVNRNLLTLIEKKLKALLYDLTLVTDDISPTLARIETAARLLQNIPSSSLDKKESSEIAAFLKWLSDGGFVFFGCAEWKVEANLEDGLNEVRVIEESPQNTLGVFRSNSGYFDTLISECCNDCLSFLEQNLPFSVSQLTFRSPIHRRERMNHIMISQHTLDGKLVGVLSIVGLFTSKSISQEASSVPIIRQRVKELMKIQKALPRTHSYKAISHIIDTMPKSLVLTSDIGELNHFINLVMNIQRESESVAFVRPDPSHKGINVSVAMPIKRFSEDVQERLTQYIEETFGALYGSGDSHVAIKKPLAIFYYYVPFSFAESPPINIKEMERELINLTKTWGDNLKDRIFAGDLFKDPESIWVRYRHAFSEEYQASYGVEQCLKDILCIERLSEDAPIKVDLQPVVHDSEGVFHLTVYSLAKELSLSYLLPILENMGLYIIREQASKINVGTDTLIFLHRFSATSKDKTAGNLSLCKENLCSGLEDIFLGKAENDYLNSLVISSNLNIRSISLLRAYCAYFWQITSFASKGSIRRTLSEIPSAASLLWNMFEVKFNPKLGSSADKRQKRLNVLMRHFRTSLRNVPDINQDRILRVLANLLDATVRTNFYAGQDYLAIKIDPSKVEIMEKPRPYFEIYVRSMYTEGIHIRFGPVARGGIRWSDRKDDFRSEILGLAKTQKLKNSLIVPTGSKGGFVVRKLSPAASGLKEQVELCYKEYIRALLSLTDNKINNKVVHPNNVICYDGDDPYLVVAADKGTATFSDIANEIAVKEFNFWLGDAFASGGSNGYDHKLYGITAKGAWESVKRHFKDLGIDYEKPFTAVGIGDMSGDVFGNGLLENRNIKLIAAFNHSYIFIDPNPDPEKSFMERERLFRSPGSDWCDYNTDLISKGGGVYERYAKEISLTPEARAALGIDDDVEDVINGEQLISLILKAPCDLLWNGGIGTYVKASSESNADVNDGTNDAVRVNASELRAKVVGEGGNLGFTQLARLEFARNGGRINTDAVDNSGGVDLSDHEVNFKILFSRLQEKGKLSLEERNKILKEVAGDACRDVLQNNARQALLLTNSARRSAKRIDYFKSLIHELHKAGYLNRNMDKLPDAETLRALAQKKQGLLRPELAIVCSAVKMYLKDCLYSSPLILEEDILKEYLLDYFPEPVRSRWEDEILEHPLKREIIATRIVNSIVDTMGATFVHRTCVNHGVSPMECIRYYIAAVKILRFKGIREETRRFDTYDNNTLYLDLCQKSYRLLVNLILWLIGFHKANGSLMALINLYRESYTNVIESLDSLLPYDTCLRFKEKLSSVLRLGIGERVAKIFASAEIASDIFEYIWISNQSGANYQTSAQTHLNFVEAFGLSMLYTNFSEISVTGRWENELLYTSLAEIRKGICEMAVTAIQSGRTSQGAIEKFISQSDPAKRVKSLLSEPTDTGFTPSLIGILARQIQEARSEFLL